MTRDTLRDQVWKQIVEYRDSGRQFRKADIIGSVDAAERTVHDVIQTATEYGLLVRREKRMKVDYQPAMAGVQEQDVAIYEAPANAPQTQPQAEKVDDTPRVNDDKDGSATVQKPSSQADDADASRDWIDAIDVPQGKDSLDCAEVVIRSRDHLDENGPASARQIVMAVMPDHSLGYDVPDLDTGDRYRGAWWRRIVQPGLQAHPGVEYRDNHQDYRIQSRDN